MCTKCIKLSHVGGQSVYKNIVFYLSHFSNGSHDKYVMYETFHNVSV